MFALPLQSTYGFSPASAFLGLDPYSSCSAVDSFIAQRQRERQHQVALAEQAREQELLRRRHRLFLEQQEQERQAELASRARLVQHVRWEEHERRLEVMRQRQAALRETKRLEQQRREEKHFHPYARQQAVDPANSLLHLLFGGLATQEDLVSPSLAVDEAPSPADCVDPPSPTLSTSPSTSHSDCVDDLDLSSSSSYADLDSDAESISSASTSSSVEVSAALSTFADLASSFATQCNAFVAPSTLSFQSSPSPSSPSDRSSSPPLAYNSDNAPLLAYEDFLLSLLTRIDAVESHGDQDVRRQRKELVRQVEKELRRIDDMKEQEWERQSGASGSEVEDEEMGSFEEEENKEDAVERTRPHPIVPFALPSSLSHADSPSSACSDDDEADWEDEESDSNSDEEAVEWLMGRGRGRR